MSWAETATNGYNEYLKNWAADDAAEDAEAEEAAGKLERGEIEPGGEIPY